MSLLGALPAIYFAGSHKRRTQGLRFLKVLTNVSDFGVQAGTSDWIGLPSGPSQSPGNNDFS